MKKTLTTILIFAAALAALLAVAALIERVRPEQESMPEVEAPAEVVNTLDELGAAMITLNGDAASVTGLGASAEGSTVTIVYPGTYRVSGELADGQLIVDCGDFPGAVYLILDGVSVTNSAGPALHVVQADRTVIHLAEGTENVFWDGADYLVSETVRQAARESSGAAIYSADDLVIEGEGGLTAYGLSADGIRSKDGITVTGGEITVYAQDDAIQGSDYVTVEGGSLTLNAYGDGITAKDGNVTVTDGIVDIISAGDGVDAAKDVNITGGELSVLAWQGAEHYVDAVIAGVSAKGVKGQNVTVTGGAVTLDTAGDGLHADDSLTVTGGEITIASGDDAMHGDDMLTVTGGTVTVTTSYEAMEAAGVRVDGGMLTVTAQTNGVDAGEDGFIMTAGLVTLTAAKPVTSEGTFAVQSGTVYLTATEAGAPVSFADGSVTGGTVVALAQGTEGELTADVIPGSFVYVLPRVQAAGTALTLADAAGQDVLNATAAQPFSGVMIASGGLGVGQSYTLTVGEYTLTGALSEGATVLRGEVTNTGFGGMGGPSGGMRPGPGMMP